MQIVDKSLSFASSNCENDNFRRMFPDSIIASKYSQGELQTKYIIQFGLARYIRNELTADIVGKPFPFKFDKSTTQQVKKCDGYITYFCNSSKKIVTSFCGPLFVVHCTAGDYIVHFFEFMEKLGLDTHPLLAIGMHWSKVNKSFQSKLVEELERRCSTHFLDI